MEGGLRWHNIPIFQTAILLLRIDDIVSGSKKSKEEGGAPTREVTGDMGPMD